MFIVVIEVTKVALPEFSANAHALLRPHSPRRRRPAGDRSFPRLLHLLSGRQPRTMPRSLFGLLLLLGAALPLDLGRDGRLAVERRLELRESLRRRRRGRRRFCSLTSFVHGRGGHGGGRGYSIRRDHVEFSPGTLD